MNDDIIVIFFLLETFIDDFKWIACFQLLSNSWTSCVTWNWKTEFTFRLLFWTCFVIHQTSGFSIIFLKIILKTTNNSMSFSQFALILVFNIFSTKEWHKKMPIIFLPSLLKIVISRRARHIPFVICLKTTYCHWTPISIDTTDCKCSIWSLSNNILETEELNVFLKS